MSSIFCCGGQPVLSNSDIAWTPNTRSYTLAPATDYPMSLTILSDDLLDYQAKLKLVNYRTHDVYDTFADEACRN